MDKKEVLKLFRRIKSHYPSFVHDEYKEFEWHNELKHYDYEEVNQKLEDHMRNEKYGEYEPKLFFLTKYLQTTQQKIQSANRKVTIHCNLCQKPMSLDEYDNHYGRCLTEQTTLKLIKRAGHVAEIEDIDYLDDEKLDALYEKYKPKEKEFFYQTIGGN